MVFGPRVFAQRRSFCSAELGLPVSCSGRHQRSALEHLEQIVFFGQPKHQSGVECSMHELQLGFGFFPFRWCFTGISEHVLGGCNGRVTGHAGNFLQNFYYYSFFEVSNSTEQNMSSKRIPEKT